MSLCPIEFIWLCAVDAVFLVVTSNMYTKTTFCAPSIEVSHKRCTEMESAGVTGVRDL